MRIRARSVVNQKGAWKTTPLGRPAKPAFPVWMSSRVFQAKKATLLLWKCVKPQVMPHHRARVHRDYVATKKNVCRGVSFNAVSRDHRLFSIQMSNFGRCRLTRAQNWTTSGQSRDLPSLHPTSQHKTYATYNHSIPLQRHSATAPQRHGVTAPRRHGITAPRHHSATAPQRHSITAPRRHSDGQI